MNKYLLSILIYSLLVISIFNTQKLRIRCSNGLTADIAILSLVKMVKRLFAVTEKVGIYKSMKGFSNWLSSLYQRKKVAIMTLLKLITKLKSDKLDGVVRKELIESKIKITLYRMGYLSLDDHKQH